MARLIQFKRGTKVNLPTLVTGEPAWVTDESKLYVGNDGVNVAIARDDHTHTPAAIGAIPATAKGAANGIATLDATSKVPAAQLPPMNYDAIGSAAAVEQKLDTFMAKKGAINGLAELSSEGKVPTSQLPSYVDDVVEFPTKDLFPSTGEAGKIYVDTTTNLAWRWSGSIYVEISPSIALGITSATALRGDWGKTAYDHSQITSGNPHGSTAADIGAVPTSRTINSKPLSANIVLVATDVGALSSGGGTMTGNINMGDKDITALKRLEFSQMDEVSLNAYSKIKHNANGLTLLQLLYDHDNDSTEVSIFADEIKLRGNVSSNTEIAANRLKFGNSVIVQDDDRSLIVQTNSISFESLDADEVYIGGVAVGEPTTPSGIANKTYVDNTTLLFTGKTVPTADWVADTTYSTQGYGFRAPILCAGVTAAYQPAVTFSVADAVDGNFAPVAESYVGGVYIYCKTIPTATITIPSISCIKGA